MTTKTTTISGDPIFNRLLNDRKSIEDQDLATLQQAGQCELAAKRINAFFQEKVAPSFSAITIANTDWQIIFQNMQKMQTAMDGIPNAKRGQLLPAMQTLVFGRLQAALKTLKNEPQALKAFLASVDAALKLFPERLASLKRALELLLDPHAFTPSPEEEEFSYKEINIKSFADMARGELFKALLALDLQNGGCEKLLDTAIQTATQTALHRRLQSALPDATETLVKKEMEKIVALKQTRAKLNGFIDLVISGMHTTYDEKSNGQFSKLMATYSDRDLRANKSAIINRAVAQGKSYEQTQETILLIIEGAYKPFYDWLLANISHVKQAYNQGDDDDRNQGEGTCLQNSVDRLCLLKKDAALDATKIPMASSKRGRFTQALVNSKVIDGAQLTKKMEQLVGHECRTAALLPSSSKKLSPQEHIASELLVQASNKPLLGIIGMKGESWGHALNIQIDVKKNIFRLIDDNTGVIEYSSQETFKEQISAYLTLLYSDVEVAYVMTFDEKLSLK